jgi:uncharacterized protein
MTKSSSSTNPITAASPTFLPMLDLFQQLRDAGMLLTMEDYEDLRRAIAEGNGLTDWEDLRDLCRMLWVKPSLNYDIEIFEPEFDRYQEQYRQRVQDWLTKRPPAELPLPKVQEFQPGEWPKIPPRCRETEPASAPETEPDKPIGEGLGAAKLDRPEPTIRKPEFVVQVPISRETVRRTWKMLRRPFPDSRLREVDVAATVERIGREGFFSDLVNRPVVQKKAELLLLVDDSNAMLPFAPVMQPLIQTVLDRRIVPAAIYRFNQYPTDYLYDWKRPLRGVPLAKVLGLLNRQRTVVMIVSEAGASNPLYREERVTGTGQFLAKLLPCVREVLWLNPLPPERWEDTTAEPIQRAMVGRMVPFEAGQWQQVAQSREFRTGVQLWPLMQG